MLSPSFSLSSFLSGPDSVEDVSVPRKNRSRTKSVDLSHFKVQVQPPNAGTDIDPDAHRPAAHNVSSPEILPRLP
jgi:hypothetical protein